MFQSIMNTNNSNPGMPVQSMLDEAREMAHASIGRRQTIVVFTRTGKTKRKSFVIKKVVGNGTFGLVSLIESGGGVQALKTVHQPRHFYHRELEIMLQLSHRNVMGIDAYYYTQGRDSTDPYLHIIMDYMPHALGYVLRDKRIGTDRIRGMVLQMLCGLQYLHGLGIAHRDIKPDNILVGQNGTVKICDFGSAKRLRDGEASIAYICSRFYRAPENLLEFTAYTTKMDMWALGAVVCEFRLAEPIFCAESSRGVLNKIYGIVGDTDGFMAGMKYKPEADIKVQGLCQHLSAHFTDCSLVRVIEQLLVVDHRKRASAMEVLQLPFFTEQD